MLLRFALTVCVREVEVGWGADWDVEDKPNSLTWGSERKKSVAKLFSKFT